MSIQWFPGHMNTARREALKTMEAIDVVVEVLDARAPKASYNPLITELRMTRRRPCLKVLNKADLADPVITRSWLKVFKEEPGVNAVALSCRHTGQAAKIPHLCGRLAPHRNSILKPLRMLIMGIPNVGKSTLINTLLMRHRAKVGNEPAVTKTIQQHALNKGMVIMDSPGLLWPKISSPTVGLMLAAIHAIGANAVVEEEIAEYLATTLLADYPAVLSTRYGMDVTGLDGMGVIEAIAKKRGCRRQGNSGELDTEKAARILLQDYRRGILGRISLEKPDMTADWTEDLTQAGVPANRSS